MTDTKQEKPQPKNLMPKPISQAFLASAVLSGAAIVFGVPIEYAPKIALAGASFSLYLSWQDSRYQTAPKKRKGRSIDFYHGKGSTKIYPDMEYSMSSGGMVLRETFPQAIWRKIRRKPAPHQQRVNKPAARPAILDEVIFTSHYKGQAIQLREKHVKLFLASVYRNRANGKGLSMRRWIRHRSQRPAWYRELSPIWFYGMSMLIWDAQRRLNKQLVVTLDNQQSFLTVEPHELYAILKWYEYEKMNRGV